METPYDEKNDPNIPSAVRAQAAKAAEMMQDIKDEKTGKRKPAPVEPEKPKSDDAEKSSPAELEKTSSESVTPVASPPVPDEWKQKYQVLMGKYNAEVPRLAEAVRQANETIARLTAQVEQQKQSPEPEKSHEINPGAIFSQEELQAYEEEGIDTDTLKALIKINQKLSVKKSDDALTSRLTNLEQTQRATVEDQFWSKLNVAVPDWRAINGDPDTGAPGQQEWAEWLQGIDPLTGYQRNQILRYHQGRLDSAAIARMFSEYKRQHPHKFSQSKSTSAMPQQAPASTVASPVTPPVQAPPPAAVSGQEYLNACRDFALGRIAEKEFNTIRDNYFASAGIKKV